MNLIGTLLYKYYHRKVMKKVRVVCTHMLLVYNYLHSANPHGHSGSYIKEAVGMLHDWERVSEHIYKHKPTAYTVEIGKYDELAYFTTKIMYIEIPHIVKLNNQLMIRLLRADAEKYISNYYKQNKPRGHN
jgi:hypothetical protein